MAVSRSAKVLILSSGQALTAVVSVVSAAVLTRIFTKLDYATYRQTLLCYTFAVPFVTLGFDRALYYFLPGETKRPRGILVENLLWMFAAGGLLSLFLLAGGNRLLAMRFHNPELVGTLLLLAPYPLLMVPAISMPACLMARNRADQVAGFSVASRVLMFLAIILPCLVWPTPSTAIIGTVAGAAVTTTAAWILMFRACPGNHWRPTWSGLRQQMFFSVPLGLASLVGTISQTLDQVLVSAICKPEIFAVFVNGAMEIPLIGMITGSVTSVVMVDYAQYYREGRLADIVALIHRAMEKCAIMLLPIMALLLCVAPELMRFLFGKPYEASAIPFRVYLLMLPVRTFTFGAVLLATGNSRYIFVQAVLSLVSNAVFAWLAIHLIGPLWASAGAVIALYFFEVPYVTFAIHRVLRCPVRELFPWSTMAKLLAASFLATPAVLVLKAVGAGWPNVVLLAAACAVYGAITAPIFVVCGWMPFSPKDYLARWRR